MAKHKHYDVIIAYANGAEIERRDPKTPSMNWCFLPNPQFLAQYEYRVKPKPKIKKWRWVMRRVMDGSDFRITNAPYATAQEASANFSGVHTWAAIYAIPESMVEVEED